MAFAAEGDSPTVLFRFVGSTAITDNAKVVPMNKFVHSRSIMHPNAWAAFQSAVPMNICHCRCLVLPVSIGSSRTVHDLA